MSLQKFIVAAGTIGLLRVIGDPAGHKQARQVRPSKLSLRPIERPDCSVPGAALPPRCGAISDPGRAFIGNNAVIGPARG
jgi:hypothetical protein